MRVWLYASLHALLPLCAAAGAANLSALDQFSESESREAEWTIAVYLAADNDLEAFGLLDMLEMERGLSGDVNVIVLIDRAEGYDDSHGDWTEARVYRIVRDSDPNEIRSRLIAEPGELNMGDPEVLRRFLTTTLRQFPARRTALVMWNHGGGWAAMAMDHGLPGDPYGELVDSLTVPELADAVAAALRANGRDKLDLIGFDMCLMAQLELAEELAPLARVMVASQAIEPGDGWPYDRVLPLFADTGRSPADIAREMVIVYDDFYRERNEAITTLSAFDLERTSALGDALDAVVGRIETTLERTWPEVSRAIYFAEGYATRSELQRGQQALASVDLLDLLRRIEANAPGLAGQPEFADFEIELDRFVLARRNSAVHRLSNGVAIYAPVTRHVFNPDYDVLRLASSRRWRPLLEALHRRQGSAGRAPSIRDFALIDTQTESSIATARPINTHGMRYVVDGVNLLWLHGFRAMEDRELEAHLIVHRGMVFDADWSIRARDTAAQRLDLMIPRFADGENRLVTGLPGYRHAVSNGEASYYATIDESGLNSATIQVPALLHRPEDRELHATIHFDPRWWHAVALVVEMPQVNGGVVYRQFKPGPEDEVTLLFEMLTRDGELALARSGRMAWRDGPELVLTLDSPGEYLFGVMAETIDGGYGHGLTRYRMDADAELDSFLELGGQFDRSDLIGHWELVQPEPFQRGEIVPVGLAIEYEAHPRDDALLMATTTSPRDTSFRERSLVFLDQRGLRHLRTFALAPEGADADPVAADFAVYVVGVYMRDGLPVMIQRNTLTGLTYVFVKPRPAAPQPTFAPPVLATLDGIWQAPDGTLLVIEGQAYQLSTFGMIVDGGALAIDGNRLISQSAYTGAVEQYQFVIDGNRLLLQGVRGDRYIYQRLR